jgi:protein SCO1/2
VQLSRNSKFSLVAFVVFDLLLAFWLIILFQARDEVEDIHSLNALGAVKYPDPYRLAPFQLSDQDGDPFLVDNFAGQWSLVFFGFTSCPDVCPITMSELAQAYRTITEMPDLPDPQVVFVSVDPERDSRQAVKRYVEQFSTDFIGLSGSEAGIGTLASQLFVAFSKVDQTGRYLERTGHLSHMPERGAMGDGYVINHNIHVSLVNPEAELVALIRPPVRRESLVQAYTLLINE